ncbi:MAG: hypothetical protein JNM85_00840 [Chthonomonas sp.]|nr:hypothetical protein [Chthonomonas sp.]
MNPPIRALLHSVFDYAGLFPPAALSMDSAVHEYAQLRTSDQAWLVRRMVCPIAWLNDFWAEAKSVANSDDPFRLTVLGTSIEGFRQDLLAIEMFEAGAKGAAYVEGYEVKGQTGEMSAKQLDHIATAGFEEAFVEVPLGEGFEESLHMLAEADTLGAKARVGGLEAAAYPAPDQLASFIQECTQLDLTYKMTAGLHHPVRHKHPTLDACEHGFLNVLIGGCLAMQHDLSRSELAALLEETAIDAFRFDSETIGWREHSVTTSQIHDFRQVFASIGSCSIDEPNDDLNAFGLLN